MNPPHYPDLNKAYAVWYDKTHPTGHQRACAESRALREDHQRRQAAKDNWIEKLPQTKEKK